MQSQKILKTMVTSFILETIWNNEQIAYNARPKKFSKKSSISHLRKELKQRIDCLQSKAKKLLKQRLDFPYEKRI